MDKLDSKQKEALDKFREAVSDVEKPCDEDGYLLQWLVARNFDVKKAEIMLRESMKWREKMGADTLVETYQMPEVFKLYYPQGFVGFDKEGCPVWISPHGELDVRGLFHSADQEDFVMYMIHQLETSNRYMAQQRVKLGKYIHQQMFIMDAQGWSIKDAFYKPALDLTRVMSKMQEDNYPEHLKKVVVINAPWFFATVFNILKSLLNERMRNKFEVYNSDRSKWVPALLEMMDASQLPEYWGGTMVDADGNGRCPSKIPLGGKVPKSYYKSNKLLSDKSMEAATIKSGGNLHLEFDVIEPNSRLRWTYQSETYDIGFVICKKEGQEWSEVVPYSRENSHVALIEGETVPLAVGQYRVTFDNSYSRIRSKNICYSVELVGPKSSEESK